MKIILSAIFCFAVVTNASFAQTSRLTLSDDHPQTGEKISLAYDPSGSVLQGSKNISGVVFYFDNKDYTAADIDFKSKKNLLEATIKLPATTTLFLLKLYDGDKIDNNDNSGFIYMVYRDGKPIAAAQAQKATLFLGRGGSLAKIKSDFPSAIDLYRKELADYPAEEKEYQAMYYTLLSKFGNDKPGIGRKIVDLEKSSDEKDLTLACRLLVAEKQAKSSDSLNKIVEQRFPYGTAARVQVESDFSREQSIKKKDSIFQRLVSKFAIEADDKARLDNFKTILAIGYLRQLDTVNYNKYKNQIPEDDKIISYLNTIAWGWGEKGENLALAESISRETVAYATAQLKSPTSNPHLSAKMQKAENKDSWNAFADTYGYILYKDNKPQEAVKFAKQVYENVTEANSTEHYILDLAALGKYRQALDIDTKAIKNGQNSTVLTDELKKDYIKVNGGEKGYDDFLTGVKEQSTASARNELVKSMVNQRAPLFTLKDLDGQTISLAELRGKVVIVDFWATWCGPCKSSFPGMQMVVDRYKNDPDVKFVFIDTWESAADYPDLVKNFITTNKYTFHVLLDEKGADGRQSKVVSDYEVTGIPTKFVIDKDGNTRFIKVGSDGNDKEIISEVSAMVDLVKNAAQNSPSQSTPSK